MTTAIKTSLSLAALAALFAACSGSGNTGQAPTSASVVKQIPWVNAALPYKDDQGVLITADKPVYPAIGQNRADVGIAAPDCGIVSRYDYAPWVATNEAEDYQAASGGDAMFSIGMAIRWAGADDLTRGSWRTPGFATWYPGLVDGLSPTVWGTPSQNVSEIPDAVAPQCDPGKPNQYVIHMRGDGFRYYGGNIAHILAGDNYVQNGVYDHTDCPTNADGSPSDLCHPAPEAGATVDSAGFPLKPTKNDPGSLGAYGLGALHTYWDVSAYEGVSFWARRGPDSFGTLLVTINDKYTSDDMNRQNETYCRRIVACHSACQNYMPCQDSVIDSDVTVGTNDVPSAKVKRCFDPNVGMPLPRISSSGLGSTDDLLDAVYPRCGNTCNFRTTYQDPDFEGKQCRPYTFTSGESAEYCFNEGDAPPSREERCVDGFTSSLQLTDQWKFYTVPFSEMRQGGYGKRAPEFDLKSVYSVTLGWGPGSVDFYIDNVSLYRPKK